MDAQKDEFIKILNMLHNSGRMYFPKIMGHVNNLHQSYSQRANLHNSTFIVSHRKTALAFKNRLVQDSIPGQSQIHQSVGREGSKLLQYEQSSHTFKSVTNLSEEVATRMGVRVMFLNNSLIDLGISNGATGIVIDVIQ